MSKWCSKQEESSFFAGRVLYGLLALLHIVCPLLFFTDLTRNPYFTQISLLYAGVFLALGLYAAGAIAKGQFRFTRTGFDGPLLILTALMGLAWGVSWVQHPALRLPIWNEGGRVTMFWLVNCLAVFGLAVQLRDEAWDERFRWMIILVGVLAGGYGILQYTGHEFIWPKSLNPYNGRPVSTFGNPNFLSSYLVLLLPLAFVEMLSSESTRRRAAFAAAFLVTAVAVICTMTRSSWIGALVAMAAVVWLTRKQMAFRKKWVAGIFVFVVMIAAFWPTSPLAGKSVRPAERIAELVQGVAGEKIYGSWHQRLMIWSCAWDMVRERPILGKGWGCFELFYPFYQGWYLADHVFQGFRTHANNAHNIVLEIWSQLGTAGMGIFLWIGLLVVESSRRGIPLLPEKERLPAWALFAGIAGMMADNFFGNVSLFFAVPAFLFWWMMGTLARTAFPRGEGVHRARGALALGLGGLLFGFCAVGMFRAFRHWRAEVNYFAGFKKAKQGEMRDAVAFLEKSYRDRRWEVNNNYELGNAYARQARWSEEKGLPQESRRLFGKALHAYDEAIAANAGYDEIHFNKAAILTQMDRTEEAVLHYRAALVINPMSLESYRALGNVYLAQVSSLDSAGSQEKAPLEHAVDHYERAVFYFPDDKDLWNNLGYLRTRLNHNEKALEAYARAYRLDVTFSVAWKNMRIALVSLGRTDHPLLAVPSLWQQAQKDMEQQRWADARRRVEDVLARGMEDVQVRKALAFLRDK
ncbi:MAG: O-antigen ligase family protein [Elusimicrobia bacterium]|nr:O-antigen ligase family protein [Elusimicrobiota bacterium]